MLILQWSFAASNDSVTLNPFGLYFDLKMDQLQVKRIGKLKNKHYAPEYFDTLLKTWLPMTPFWTCMLLGMSCISLYKIIALGSLLYIGELERHRNNTSLLSGAVVR